MKLQIIKNWSRLRSSFWFTPASMALGAVVLAITLVSYDAYVSEWMADRFGWRFRTGADGASAVLGVIAGSMITIAGVVFSMTLVALSLASSQLGPRLLRNFMRDTSTQVVLGTFIATFVYCLLVLRTIRRDEAAAFVPHLSVSLGVVLAVVSVGVFIYFIHHVAVSIQANEIAARLGKETIERMQKLFPDDIGEAVGQDSLDPSDESLEQVLTLEIQCVAADRNGYLQLIDGDALLELATKENVVVRMERKPGNYVTAGCTIASVFAKRPVSDGFLRQIHTLYVLGNQRTSDQDMEFGVNQLVEIAVRALSPGLNDPFTAIACVDHLGSVLSRLAERKMPSPYRQDHEKHLRLILRADTFCEVADAAFNQIRQYAGSSAAVSIRLLDTIELIANFVRRSEDRSTLLRHAAMIARGAIALPETEDRLAVERRWQAVAKQLDEAAGAQG
ncbi:MAG: DUF2254 domain-containing protein [Aquimonas sp.]|nr:DUF2254 domain-containing protein [Aquimonas sp.]